ncbi:proton-conducting transporter membrane subunit [Actinopolymorpha sp. NPDC004070]|uniref:complex I subunit 5 family protein n=1 Tax=Actinopolymorpha sp. NPDC004070 TaxID=3154548 RepID=UPI0033A353CD
MSTTSLTSTSTLDSLLPLPAVVLIIGATVCPLLGRVSSRAPVIVAVLACGTASGILALFAPAVYSGRLLVTYLGGWTPKDGAALGIAFAADPFGLSYALAVTVVSLVLTVFTLSMLGGLGRRELGGYACLFLLLAAALVGIALTADAFNMFVWLEVAALASYALTGFFLERPTALEAAFKILVLTTIGTFCVFVGTGILYARYGALNLGQLHHALEPRAGVVGLLALGLVITGYGTKAGLIPFHGWLADAHTAAPGPVSAMFSGLMVSLGVVGIARFAFLVYGRPTPVLGVLMVVGVVSAVVGALLSLGQDDLKRLLAYDTVSQIGVVTAGLAIGTRLGVAGGAYQLLNHTLFKTLLFLCAGTVLHTTGKERLSELGGLARKMPLVAAAFLVGVLAISGLPPLNGYVSVGLIHEGLEETHQYVPLAALLLSQAVTVAALGRATWRVFFGPARGPAPAGESARPGMVAGFLALATLCVAFGAVPELLLDRVLGPAADWLLDAGDYGRSVLAGGGHVTLGPALTFDYLAPKSLLVALATAAVGVLLARRYAGDRVPGGLVTPLRRLHTGSVNDYASFLVAGLLLVCGGLLAGRLG